MVPLIAAESAMRGEENYVILRKFGQIGTETPIKSIGIRPGAFFCAPFAPSDTVRWNIIHSGCVASPWCHSFLPGRVRSASNKRTRRRETSFSLVDTKCGNAYNGMTKYREVYRRPFQMNLLFLTIKSGLSPRAFGAA